VWAAFGAYGWPGNVRGLHNVVERCVLSPKASTSPEHDLAAGDEEN
jgi:DNA-binding NtrC family response regulator